MGMFETAEILRRVQANDAAPATLEALEATVAELCCQYATRPAASPGRTRWRPGSP